MVRVGTDSPCEPKFIMPQTILERLSWTEPYDDIIQLPHFTGGKLNSRELRDLLRFENLVNNRARAESGFLTSRALIFPHHQASPADLPLLLE